MWDQTDFLGLVSVSFRNLAPREILEAMKAAGLSRIEWGSDVHAPCLDLARLQELAALQREYGIRCSSYGTYFRLGEEDPARLSEYIAAAKLLDTEILRLWCGRKSGAEWTGPEKEKLLGDCRRAAKIAEENGVILCLECHRKTFTERPEDAVWLMETVDSPHFQMYWQPFQWQSAEENLRNAERIAPYARCLHVFHWKNEKKLPLSQGIEEWKDYLKKFSLPRPLLLEFMPGGTPEELPAEAAALRKIAGV